MSTSGEQDGLRAGSAADTHAPHPTTAPATTGLRLDDSQTLLATHDPAIPWPGGTVAAAWLILLFGAGLRLLRYAGNRSLWLDEAWLALNIVRRSFAQLILPLDHGQGAPIGFLWAVKAATLALGSGEKGLRFVPLVAGLLALPVVYLLVRRVLRWEAGLFALGLFALAESGLYYASETKQYSTDALLAACVLLVGVKVLRHGCTRGNVIALVAVGVVGPWFSHPSTFMLAGLGATLGLRALVRRQWRDVGLLLGIAAAWATGFGVLYWVSLRHLLATEYLTTFWRRYFLPFPPRSLNDLQQYVTAYYESFAHALGVTYHEGHEVQWLTLLAAATFTLGVYHLLGRRNWLAALLVLPILVTMGASAAHSYPFTRRMLVFLSPVFVVGIGVALAWLFDLAVTRADRRRLAVFASAILLLPLAVAGSHLRPVPPRQEVRDAVRFLKEHARDGDRIFGNHYAAPGYDFYRARFGVPEMPMEYENVGPPYADAVAFADRVSRSPGRVWVLIASVHPTERLEQHFHALLQPRGRVLDEKLGHGCRLVLYEFSPTPTTGPATAPLGQ